MFSYNSFGKDALSAFAGGGSPVNAFHLPNPDEVYDSQVLRPAPSKPVTLTNKKIPPINIATLKKIATKLLLSWEATKELLVVDIVATLEEFLTPVQLQYLSQADIKKLFEILEINEKEFQWKKKHQLLGSLKRDDFSEALKIVRKEYPISEKAESKIEAYRNMLVGKIYFAYVELAEKVSMEEAADIIVNNIPTAYLISFDIDFYKKMLSTEPEQHRNIPLLYYIEGDKETMAKTIYDLIQQKIQNKKTVVPMAERVTLATEKQKVIKEFDKYICWWKFSLFGHHHDDRARAVKAQVLRCSNHVQLKELLESQVTILKMQPREKVSSNWASRWNEKANLKNQPADLNKSGYASVIQSSLKLINT